jgi:hypothetical protein
MTAFIRVEPGDLITADFMNTIVDELSALEERVKKLEGAPVGAAPVITAIDPKGPLKVSSSFRIVGRNFRVPADLNNTVAFGKIAKISRFLPGSDDTSLTVVVPDVFGGIPQKIDLTVSNANGTSNEWEIQIQGEEEVPKGETVLRDVTGATGKVTEGMRLRLLFELDARTTLPETYDLSAIYSNPEGVGDDAWLKATSITPEDATASAGHPVTIPVDITIPTGAKSIDVVILAKARRNPDLTVTSSAVHIAVGEAQEVSDDRTVLKLSDIGPFAEIRYVTIGGINGVEFPVNKTSTVSVDVGSKVAGTYIYEASVEDKDAGFEIGTPDPKQSTETALGGQTVTIPVSHTLAGMHGAGATWMRIQASHMEGGSPDFVSFIRFPIRGF